MGEAGFGKAHQLITMYAAFMFEPLFLTHQNLGRKPIMSGVDRGTNDGGKPGIQDHLTAHDHKGSLPLGIMGGGMSDQVNFTAFHGITW